MDALLESGLLRDYPMAPAVRADLLERLGRREEAGTEFERAAALTRNESERAISGRRAADCR